jgi:hypothetical protein
MTIEPTTFICDADLYGRVAVAVSTDPLRCYLGGVYVEPHHETGVIMTATDGSRLISIHDPDATLSGPAVIVRVDKAILKACITGKRDQTPRRLVARIANGRGTASVMVSDAANAALLAALTSDVPEIERVATQCGQLAIDGTFPDWRRVMPQGALIQQSGAHAINARHLASVAEALSDSGDAIAVIAGYAGKDGPAVIIPASREIRDRAIGLVMPVAMKHIPEPASFWTAPQATTQAA